MGEKKEKIKKDYLDEESGNNTISLYSAIMLVLMVFSWTTKMVGFSVVDANIPIPPLVLNIIGGVSTVEALLTLIVDKYKGIIPTILGKDKEITLKKDKDIIFKTEKEQEKYKSFLHDRYYGKDNEKKIHPFKDTRKTIYDMNHTGVDEDIYTLHDGVNVILSTISYPFILMKNIIKRIGRAGRLNNSIKFVDSSLVEERDNVVAKSIVQNPGQSLEQEINQSLVTARNSKEAYTVYLNKENPIKIVIGRVIYTKWKISLVDDDIKKDKYLAELKGICDFLIRSLDLSGIRLVEAGEFISEQLTDLEKRIGIVLPEEIGQLAETEVRELNVHGVEVYKKIIKNS